MQQLLRNINKFLDALWPSTRSWNGAAVGLLVLTGTVILLYFSFSVAASFSVQKLPAFVLWLTTSAGAGALVLLGAWGLMQLPPRFRWTVALCAPVVLTAVIHLPDTAGYIGLAILLLLASGIGGSLANLLSPAVDSRLPAVVLGVCAMAVAVLLWLVFASKEATNPALANYELDDWTLDLPNPGERGIYQFSEFSYGSGQDLRRPEFAEDAYFIARSVDGSKIIDNWDGLSGYLRSSYWGFGVDELPLQGRVWMPEGEGPFPLVLVVHGNHSMEDFSDPGYDYLGEHLASRGIILVSVDENFINGSFSARVNFFANRPGLREENDARGWLLLEHLRQWRDWNAEADHPMASKVDMERLALIGHSRGGEAVGVAAAFNSLPYYPDDATMAFDFGFNLRGVIAIAPVYGQYEARERPTQVEDVNFFTIHGDMDGDVQSFEGLAQYSRFAFSGDAYRFRSGLYVVGANHGQFNTTWENLDSNPFFAWVLDTGGIMDAEDQRDVARVYFSAFLESVFYDRPDYLPLFKDARYGAAWLPRTFFINQFEDSNQRILVDFENDMDVLTLDLTGGSVETEHLTRWFEAGNRLKYDELDSYSLFLAWDQEVNADTARVRFNLGESETIESLILALSATDMSSKPTDWENEEEASSNSSQDAPAQDSQLLDWTIRLEDGAGNTASAKLSADSPLYPLVEALPRRAGFLDDTDATERIFRRFELPIKAFEASPQFNAQAVRAIEFLFDQSPAGAIAVDYIAIDSS